MHARVHTRSLTNGGDERGVERVLGESDQDARLAYAAVPYEQQLEQKVVRLRPRRSSQRCYAYVRTVKSARERRLTYTTGLFRADEKRDEVFFLARDDLR